MHRFANPARFLRLTDQLMPWLLAAMLLALGGGLYLALLGSPSDYRQGELVRVMYVHVPAAWMASGVYLGLVIASAVSLIWRHPLADVSARTMAPIGAVFTAICLITGSIWGYPAWGTWWAWDGRMTSVLVLLFLYLGYSALWSALEERDYAARAAAILAIIGGVNLPIIKFSVDWWQTLHQGASVLRRGGPAMPATMLTPLLVMWLAYILIFAVAFIWRMRARLAQQKMLAMQARADAPAPSRAVYQPASMAGEPTA